MQQRTDEWFAARLGKATASRMGDLMAKTKAGYGASRSNYLAELAIERLTGRPTERFTTAAMAAGTEREPDGRSAYELDLNVMVEEIGFIGHPEIADSGASPDGLVDDAGAIEIKCPQQAAHFETLLTASVPEKYVKQIQWVLACSGRRWCDYVSFNPDFPPAMRLFVKRIERDDVMIADMEREVVAFLAELDAKVAALQSRYGVTAEAA